MLETPRLKLRPFLPTDTDALYQYASDPEFSQYLNYPAPSNIADAQNFLSQVEQGLVGNNLYAICLKADDEKVIGAVQFHVDEEIATLHYEIQRELWGQGLGYEAADFIVKWGLGCHPAIQTVEADTASENTRSRKLLEKLGMRLKCEQDGVAYYAGLRQELNTG